MTRQEFIADLIDKSPGPIISRPEASRLTGYTKKVAHLANLDSQGLGCPDRVRIGRRMGYITASFGAWFADQVDGLED